MLQDGSVLLNAYLAHVLEQRRANLVDFIAHVFNFILENVLFVHFLIEHITKRLVV